MVSPKKKKKKEEDNYNNEIFFFLRKNERDDWNLDFACKEKHTISSS